VETDAKKAYDDAVSKLSHGSVALSLLNGAAQIDNLEERNRWLAEMMTRISHADHLIQNAQSLEKAELPPRMLDTSGIPISDPVVSNQGDYFAIG